MASLMAIADKYALAEEAVKAPAEASLAPSRRDNHRPAENKPAEGTSHGRVLSPSPLVPVRIQTARKRRRRGKRRRAASGEAARGAAARTAGGAGEAENLAGEHKDGSRLAASHQIATVFGISPATPPPAGHVLRSASSQVPFSKSFRSHRYRLVWHILLQFLPPMALEMFARFDVGLKTGFVVDWCNLLQHFVVSWLVRIWNIAMFYCR
nr:uncharacterized protein LOC127347545 [Lolium perenne]